MLSGQEPDRGRRLRRSASITGCWLLGLAILAGDGSGQSTKVGTTLRYGSGLLDVPVANVLPDGAFSVTYSGFFTSNQTDLFTNDSGDVTALGPFQDEGWRGDFAFAYGLWDLLEVGGTLQSLDRKANGGPLMGAFGRLTLVHAEKNGFGLAVGGRWLNGPNFGDGVEYAPTRLGVADRRFRRDLGGKINATGFTFYTVGSFDLEGPTTGLLPRNDWTLTGGWGTGLFREGGGFDWYENTDSNGWFAGAALHMELAPGTILTIESEYTGFDINAGVGLDLKGIRIGAHVLGANYSENRSIYLSRKFGLSAGVALCPGGFCRPDLRRRVTADTVFLPAPPPDTVIRREAASPLPVGESTSLCLANGEDISVMITAAGDTLIGPQHISVSSLRPAFEWAGVYAEGRAWQVAGALIDYGGRQFRPVPGLVRVGCSGLVRVGDYMGVPVFASRDADRPYGSLFVPVRPGVWRVYEAAGEAAGEVAEKTAGSAMLVSRRYS
jgi:hypothetical protein